MAYPTTAVFNPQLTSPFVGFQPILTFSTVKNHPFGTRARAFDIGTAACGEAEYIYLPGVASTVAGSLVCFDLKAPLSVLIADDGATSIGPAAISMSANILTTTYGWYAVQWVVPVDSGANTTAANALVYLSGTGQIDDADVAGDLVTGAFTVTANSAGFTHCILSYPFFQQKVSD